MSDLIMWLILMAIITYMACTIFFIIEHNKILNIAVKILIEENNHLLVDIIKLTEDNRLAKIQLDNLCRKVK